MNIAIVCYASVGGSGILATELAKCLAARGHQIHVVSREQPFRLGDDQPGVVFHRVVTPAYPLFREPQYVLALATRITQISRAVDLDVVHAHYADAGWAGAGRDAAGSHPLVSAGVGVSFLDGIFRIDLARGLVAPTGWRLDFSVDGIL